MHPIQLIHHHIDHHNDDLPQTTRVSLQYYLTLGLGLPVDQKRVERLMREAGIQGLYRRRRSWTTVRDPHAEPGPDLVNRQFTVDSPDRLWITDITEHSTEEGKLYCAAVPSHITCEPN